MAAPVSFIRWLATSVLDVDDLKLPRILIALPAPKQTYNQVSGIRLSDLIGGNVGQDIIVMRCYHLHFPKKPNITLPSAASR